ncbi:MAG: phage holin family protein [Candidatus Dormibacteraceae bacterium]
MESAADLATGLIDDAQKLARLQIELAKQETKELVISNAIAAALLVGAAFLVTIAIFVIVPVLIVVILPWHWQVAAIWFGAYVVLAAGMAIPGKLLLKLQPPRRTIESLKETLDWLRHQMRSSVR